MSSFIQSPITLPQATHHSLAPLDTPLRLPSSPNASPDSNPSTACNNASATTLVDMPHYNRDRIFANATIPLSPDVSPTMSYKEQGFDGLAPRRRNGFARLFTCFGREERARRRAQQFMEYEKVGEKCHWSEL